MRSRLARLVLALAALAAPIAAQSPPPLDKSELIRLLTNPLFAQNEVAEVVRRSCLTFSPTERDWTDLRSAGASGAVIATAAACDTRRAANAAAASASAETAQQITAVAQPAEVVTTAGTAASVRVRLSRGRTPLRRTTLALRGTAALGLPQDASAVTDDSGIAVFRLPAVSRAGRHQFEIRGGGGATLPGQPAVLFSVRSAKAGRVHVTPDYILFRSEDTTAAIVAAVTDSLGNPVSGEPVDLVGGTGAPQTSVTDSGGRATFAVTPKSVSRGAVVQVRVRGLPPADVEIAAAAGLSGVNTGFLPLAATSGGVGSQLGGPVIFRARSAVEHGIFMVGDASGIVDPLTGNGMAMAIQSALVAAPFIVDALGQDRARAENAYRQRHHDLFAKRIHWSRRAAFLLSRPALLNAALAAVRGPAAGAFLVRHTRADREVIARLAESWFTPAR